MVAEVILQMQMGYTHLVNMRWNKSYCLLRYKNRFLSFSNSGSDKIYANSLQFEILSRFFDTKEFTLNQVIEAFKDSYALQEIMEVVYWFIKDAVILPHPCLKVALIFPEKPLHFSKASRTDFTNIEIDIEHPDLTVFVIADLCSLKKAHFLNLKTKQFTIIWSCWHEIKLFPLFETLDTMSFFCFLHRLKRIYYRQLLAISNQKDAHFHPENELSIQLVVDYLPNFIQSGESKNTLLIFEKEKLEIKRIFLSDRLIKASANIAADIVDAHCEPADIIEVFKQLSFHREEVFGLVSKFNSVLTPFGGWVTSAGEIYRSNKISAEIFFSKVRASGNGLTQEEAEAKAFCETLERYSQLFREHEDHYLINTYENLGSSAIHPDEILLYSAKQYSLKTARNHIGDQLQVFDEKAAISWSSIEDGLDHTCKWIPTSLLYLGEPLEDTLSEKFFKWITNGTAAGATRDMAKLHALYELIERDAYAIWWYNSLDEKAIDIHSISHLSIVALALKEHEKAGKKLYIFDVTQDISVPTVAVISDYLDGQFIIACGTNINFNKACTKAFNELNQLYLNNLSTNRKLSAFQIQDVTNTLNNHKPEMPAWELQPTNVTLLDELKIVETAISKQGLTIFYKDLTRKDVLLPVVKAVVPGMRDLDARFAPGRLFSVTQDVHGFRSTEDKLRNFNLFL